MRAMGEQLLSSQTSVDSLADFATEVEPRMHKARTEIFGGEVGREATLMKGWLAPIEASSGLRSR